MERQHRIRHRAVGHLLVDAELVPAPVAARGHRALGVDRHLRAAAAALEAHQHRAAAADVARAGGDDRAIELVDALAESELLLDPRAVPFVAAEQADQQVGAGPLADVGGAALRDSG